MKYMKSICEFRSIVIKQFEIMMILAWFFFKNTIISIVICIFIPGPFDCSENEWLGLNYLDSIEERSIAWNQIGQESANFSLNFIHLETSQCYGGWI